MSVACFIPNNHSLAASSVLSKCILVWYNLFLPKSQQKQMNFPLNKL